MKKSGWKKGIMGLMAGACLAVGVQAEEWERLWSQSTTGEYDSAPFASLQFGEYVAYQDRMPVSFVIQEGNLNFSASGVLTVGSDRVEKSFYKECEEEGAAWVSYFKSLSGKKQKSHVNIKGIEVACGRYVYPVQELELNFSDAVAQQEWESKYAEKDKAKRDTLAGIRMDEQMWRERVRDNTGTYTDSRDGQVYRTIKIDDRVWMAQNLNFDVPGKSWCYDSKDSSCSRGGRLYDLAGARAACPKGWHLPRDREFTEMLTNLTRCYSGVHTCKDFGRKLKAKVGWDGEKGTDEYGFAVYSTGYRDPKGTFAGMGAYSGFWTNQSGRVETNYIWVLEKDASNMQRLFAPSKGHAYALRCVEGD